MLKRHSILITIIVSLILLVIATRYYPGGSQYNPHAPGWDWRNNYLSNLFGARAINGMPNTARPWATAGMLLLCLGFIQFFIIFSKRIPRRAAASIVKYTGVAGMTAIFFAATPFHDIAITIADVLILISFFYITVFVFKARLGLLKVFSVIGMLSVYCCTYMYYGSQYLGFLPVMQKLCLAIVIGWILILYYGTTERDFLDPKKFASS